MKQPKSYILIKAISLLLCLLLSSSIFNVIASAVTYSLKVEFEILAINPDNDEYTGPGFDTDGMGFTVYYGDENNLQTVSYSITGNERTNDKTGMQYAYVSFQGEPRYIEYYSEGTYIGDNENCWDMQAVYLKNTMMWEGSICASAKGVSSYIAKLNLRTGSISRESGNEVAGAWIETSTTYFLKHERIPTKTYITQGNPNYTIGKQPLEKEVWISLTDDFGISYESEDVASLMKDSLVTVTCNFSESSEGFEFDTWFDYQYVVDDVVEPKSITATIKWVHYSYIDLKLIIHPEAVGDTWDEQTLSFTIKYHDLNSDKEVEFEVPNTITVSDYDVNFTLDANGGYFENGENDVNSITHARKYNNKAGDYPIPVKAGHTFNGYYITKDENLADDISPDSEKLTANTIMAENCTWYASWIKKDYCATFSYLNENGKRVYDEKFYKYGEEYSAPEIPLEVNYKDDVLFVFTGWSPEFTDTQIMTDANLYYEAQYRTEPYMKLNENNFYEIKTVKQILFFAEKVANGEVYANAILMNDIDLKDVAWTPIENYSGTFDGGNNTIKNLNCVSDNGNAGLFAKVTNGTVKNLHIADSSFQGSESVGAIAGSLSGNIYNCYVDHVTVTGGNSVGALIGTFDSGIAVACHAYNGSLFGSSGNVFISNCYYLSETETADGGRTAEQFASGEVAYLLQQGNTAQVWGQMSNVDGSFPVLTSKDLYKVIKIDETGNYSVANVGDTNGDGIVDAEDYQALVNMAVSAGHSQTETASYDDIVRYDLNGDGYVDALDAQVMNLVINDMATFDVYAVGDYDLNGVAFEEADILAMAEAMGNPEALATYEKYACDLNADGKVSYDDLNTLTSMFPLYFVGEA